MNDVVKEKLSRWRWRLNHLYKIVDKNGQLVTFRENWMQRRINDCKSRHKDILKYRQGGCTTNEVIKQLDFVSFHKNKSAGILAHDRDTLEIIFDKVRLAHKHMPDWCRPEIDRGGGSKYHMRFPKLNSEIWADIEVRGGTTHWLHISEAAFADHNRIKATTETVPATGVITRETTPNGMGNHFYRRWIDKTVTSTKIFFPWFLHPEYRLDGSYVRDLTDEELEFCERVAKKYKVTITKDQIAFRRKKQTDLKELFIQEYPEDDISCFLASGGAAMDLVLIKRLLDQTDDPLEDHGELKIFKPYDSKRLYACGADTAEGRGGDYSVGVMYDVQTREEVAQIRSNTWRPREFAIQLDRLCRMYYKDGRIPPLLGVERNNHGHAVLLELEEHLDYPNLYHYDADGEIPGWKTDSVTRPLMIDAFIDGVENRTVKLNGRDTLGECLTLIDNNGKIEAEEGENDDCIIAAAIGLQMCIISSGDLDLYNDIQTKILL